jgi:hypothetical protein
MQAFHFFFQPRYNIVRAPQKVKQLVLQNAEPGFFYAEPVFFSKTTCFTFLTLPFWEGVG